MERIRRSDAPLLLQRLQLGLHLVEDSGVEEVAELATARRAEQLAEEVAVERERLRLALGERDVALIEVRGDVRERERARERRGGGGLHLVDAHLAAADRAQQLDERGQVED